MQTLSLNFPSKAPARILCLGAHCDDIEIGCGGTLLRILDDRPDTRIDWVILCSDDGRLKESAAAAEILANGRNNIRIRPLQFRDGYLPYEGAAVKEALHELTAELKPDLVFTHYGKDAHQDHRLISKLTWNLFRNHLILEYEIPKYDGDLASPNVFVPLARSTVDRKIQTILDSFESQSGKHWFSDETFRSILRLRGIESGRDNEYAEGFYCRKIQLLPLGDG